MSSTHRIVVIVGPTAGGKSDLAVALAIEFGGEITSADSMQVYRHLDAGTAKPTAEQRAAVPHHLIDIVEPTEPFTVADWIGRAEAIIANLHERNRLPIIVGGTNLYIKNLLEGMFEGPPADEAFRASLAGSPAGRLHDRLKKIDPDAAARIHPNDRKRITRALEVHHTTGDPISEWQRQWSEALSSTENRNSKTENPHYRHAPILLGLRWPAETINRRINARAKRMFHPPEGEEGLIDETRRLLDAGLLGPPGNQAREAIGTKQVLDHLAGRCTAEEALERVKIETRRFAKNQRTWLKRYRGVHWLDAAEQPAEDLIAQAIRVVRDELDSSST